MAASLTLTKEQEEQFALDQFRGASGLLPGKDRRVRPDPPDFVVTNGVHRTAVETTRYHRVPDKRAVRRRPGTRATSNSWRRGRGRSSRPLTRISMRRCGRTSCTACSTGTT